MNGLSLLRFVHLWIPPASRMMLVPGCNIRWYVFAKTSCWPDSSASLRSTPFRAAFVATATYPGVSIVPCGVWMRPTLAPLLDDWWSSSNLKKLLSSKAHCGKSEGVISDEIDCDLEGSFCDIVLSLCVSADDDACNILPRKCRRGSMLSRFGSKPRVWWKPIP